MQSRGLRNHQYDGPFKVLYRTDEHYTLDTPGQKKLVSLDHHKPGYMDRSPAIVMMVEQKELAVSIPLNNVQLVKMISIPRDVFLSARVHILVYK